MGGPIPALVSAIGGVIGAGFGGAFGGEDTGDAGDAGGGEAANAAAAAADAGLAAGATLAGDGVVRTGPNRCRKCKRRSRRICRHPHGSHYDPPVV
jgi:hypothetical protein